MVKRVIKKTGEEIFSLGLGCMRFPTKNGSIDEEVTKELIFKAIDNGVNYLDTAYAYHNGSNESFLGEVLSTLDENGVPYRDKVNIATKLPSWLVKSHEDMDKYLNEQLSNLKVDCIDYYLVHNVDLSVIERLEDLGLFDFLNKAKSAGKIKYIGFSYHGIHGGFEEVVDKFDWDMCLVQYNYLDTNIQAGYDGIQYAHSKGLGVFIMEPLKGGLLAGALPGKVESLFVKRNPHRSNADWALSWIFNHKEVTCVLSGIDDMEKLDENLAIAKRIPINSLNEEEMETIKEAQEIIHSLVKIPCTTCGYCMPCPRGVNIPECFKIYNEKFLFNKKGFGPVSNALMKYYMLVGGVTNKAANAGLCNNCGACTKMCPQFMNVPKNLKVVKKEFETPGFKYQVSLIKKVALPFFTKVSNVFDLFKNS